MTLPKRLPTFSRARAAVSFVETSVIFELPGIDGE